MTREQAEARLIGWRAMHDQRDEFVREAYAAGVSINRIHTLTGIGRNTIYRILEKS
jgi:DNA invertase Pin-like site-specific DNA recombinase